MRQLASENFGHFNLQSTYYMPPLSIKSIPFAAFQSLNIACLQGCLAARYFLGSIAYSLQWRNLALLRCNDLAF